MWFTLKKDESINMMNEWIWELFGRVWTSLASNLSLPKNLWRVSFQRQADSGTLSWPWDGDQRVVCLNTGTSWQPLTPRLHKKYKKIRGKVYRKTLSTKKSEKLALNWLIPVLLKKNCDSKNTSINISR